MQIQAISDFPQFFKLGADARNQIAKHLSGKDICALEACSREIKKQIDRAQSLWKAVFAAANAGYCPDGVTDWKNLVRVQTLVLRNLNREVFPCIKSKNGMSITCIAGKFFKIERDRLQSCVTNDDTTILPPQGMPFEHLEIDSDYFFTATSVDKGTTMPNRVDLISGTLSIWYRTECLLTVDKPGRYIKEDNLLVHYNWSHISPAGRRMTIWNLDNPREHTEFAFPAGLIYISTKKDDVFCFNYNFYIINWKKGMIRATVPPPEDLKDLSWPTLQINDEYLYMYLHYYSKQYTLSLVNPVRFEDCPISEGQLIGCHVYGRRDKYSESEIVESFHIPTKQVINTYTANMCIDEQLVSGDFVLILDTFHRNNPVSGPLSLHVFDRISGKQITSFPVPKKIFNMSIMAGLLRFEAYPGSILYRMGTWEKLKEVSDQLFEFKYLMVSPGKYISLLHVEPKKQDDNITFKPS